MKVIGVDLGGTMIKSGLVSENGELLKTVSRPTEAQAGKEKVLSNLEESILELLDPEVEAVGIAVASPLDPEEGILFHPPNLPGFGVFNLKKHMERKLNLPFFVNNDANLYALGEWWRGAAKGARVLLCLTIGTGVGGGLIVNGKIYTGAHGLAAEFGHITIDPNGPVCHCGNRGCLEAMASSYFLVGFVKKALAEGEASILSGKKDITPKIIFDAARSGDSLAKRAFEVLGRNLGVGVASLSNALDPDVVVIGGGLSKAGMLLLEPVIKEVDKRILRGLKGRFSIRLAELGEYSAVLGAAFYAIQKMGGGK